MVSCNKTGALKFISLIRYNMLCLAGRELSRWARGDEKHDKARICGTLEKVIACYFAYIISSFFPGFGRLNESLASINIIMQVFWLIISICRDEPVPHRRSIRRYAEKWPTALNGSIHLVAYIYGFPRSLEVCWSSRTSHPHPRTSPSHPRA